jgi:hypothetical protein
VQRVFESTRVVLTAIGLFAVGGAWRWLKAEVATATVVITRVARRVLNEAVAEHRAPAEDGTPDAGSRLNNNAVGVS